MIEFNRVIIDLLVIVGIGEVKVVLPEYRNVFINDLSFGTDVQMVEVNVEVTLHYLTL